jgi:lysozyme
MASIELLKKMLILDEGDSPTLYKCTAGKWTIGVGRNLEAVPLAKHERMYLLESDISRVLTNAHVHDIITPLDPVRQAVIIDMAFNLGINGLLKFEGMLTALKMGNYDLAALEMLDSRWAVQVGHRATRLASMMKSGTIHEDYQ